MLAPKRHQAIMRELDLRGSVSVSEVSERLGVSGMTIRRDLLELEGRGLLDRVHGGAVRRSAHGRGPVRGPLATIGLVVPSSTYYFPAVIAGAKAAAGEAGVRLVLAVSEYTPEVERHQIRRLLASGVDGLIVTPSEVYGADSETYRLLGAASVPVIVMERSLDDAPVDILLGVVRTDHAHGARIAVRHLVDRGCRRIAVALRDAATAVPLREGYRRAMADLLPGTPLVDVDLGRTDHPAAEVRARLESTLDICIESQADGLIVLPDDAAIAIINLATDRGLSIPGDLAILAYDDEVASLASTPLTAIAPPKADVGAVAVRTCLERISRRHTDLGAAPGRIDLLPSLIARESTALFTHAA